MYLACLLATLAAFPQDPRHEPTIAERIDALIAKTDAYEHFHARYRLHSTTGEESEFVLAYLAPARAKFETKGHDVAVCYCIVGGETHISSRKPGSGPVRGTLGGGEQVQVERDRLETLLHAAFPDQFRSDDLPTGWGIRFAMRMDEVAPPGKDGFNIDVNTGLGPVTRLGWLGDARRTSERATASTEGPAAICFSPSPSIRISISAESGFVQKIERKGPQGFVEVVTLGALDVATPPEASEFELPPAETGTKDITADLNRGRERTILQSTRSCFYSASEKLISDGRVKWNPEVREKLVRVLEAEHAELIRQALQERREKIDADLGELSSRIEAALQSPEGANGAALEKLREQAKADRQALEKTCGSLGGQYLAAAFESRKPRAELGWRQELEDLENGFLPRVFEERFTKPVLAYFDEKIAKQFEAK